MKFFVVLFFGMLLWTQQTLAYRAGVSFYTKRGESFQVVINGRLINPRTDNQIRLNDIPSGYHNAEIRLPGRYGVLVHRTRIFLEPGQETEYLVEIVGHRPKIILTKVATYPINGGIVPPPPPPIPVPTPRDPDYRDNDRDDYQNRDKIYECSNILKGAEFDRFYRAVAARPFDNDKLVLTKQVLNQSTIYADDLKSLLKLFSFDDNKVELAKYMYPNTCDQRNFYVVYDAFSFESNRRELERYISNLPR